MKFETEYKNIHFVITLENVVIEDISQLFGDKFNRLPNQTLIELKKGNLIAYHLIIKSILAQEERTHYWSNVLLTAEADDLLDELGGYLENEDILDLIVENWELGGSLEGPAWSQALVK